MKVVVTTVYNNVDEEWLTWYCEQLKATLHDGLIKSLRDHGRATLESKDPTSKVVGKTVYEVRDN